MHSVAMLVHSSAEVLDMMSRALPNNHHFIAAYRLSLAATQQRMDVRQLLRSDTATVHYSVPTAAADKLPSCSDSSLDA